jgi:shikimate kinase
MGCGKTTISSKLETIFNLPSIDLDQFIENELIINVNILIKEL